MLVSSRQTPRSVAATNVQFGPRYLSVADLCSTEASLAGDFPTDRWSLNEYVRRIAKEARGPGESLLSYVARRSRMPSRSSRTTPLTTPGFRRLVWVRW